MRIRTLLPVRQLGSSGSRTVALALTAGLSTLGADLPSAGLSAAAASPLAQGVGYLAQANAQVASPVLLRPGAEGNEVVLLQRQMRLLGLYQGPVDGRYDGTTQAAIAAFQTSAGLPASGTLDQTTWQRMGTPQLLADAAPAAPAPPVLFPQVANTERVAEEVVTGGRSPSTTATAPEPAEPPATEAPEPAEPAESAESDPGPASYRTLGWWAVGSLSLVGCLVGWLGLGRGQQRPPTQGLDPLPPQSDRPPDSNAGDTAASATESAHRPADLPGQDLPLEATTRLSSVDIVDSLVQELASGDGAVRRHAIWELGQRGHSNAIQPLVDGLLQADSQEKSLILAALAEISSRSLKPMHRALALGLQDPSPEVRKNAIRDLSRVYDTVVQLSHMLAHASQDPDPEVQETAQWALSQLNRIPAAPYPSEPTAPEGHRLPPSQR